MQKYLAELLKHICKLIYQSMNYFSQFSNSTIRSLTINLLILLNIFIFPFLIHPVLLYLIFT